MNQVELLSREYGPSYNCASFAAEVWEFETGSDITEILTGFLKPAEERKAYSQLRYDFEMCDEPRSPCIVLMRRPHCAPHVGVFIRDRVLHLTTFGAIRQPLDIASIGYTSVRFYAPRLPAN